MLIRKINPQGIDKIIDSIQVKLDNQLNLGTWENNHRAYKNPKPNSPRGYIAEVYTSKGNYRECFYDDNFDAVSFFLIDDKHEINNGKINQNFSLIFHVDLNNIYSNIQHRADEELKIDVLNVLNSYSKSFIEIQSIEIGIKNVYKEFDFENIKYDDMSNIFCIRFNMNTNYDIPCCQNC